MLAAEEKAVVGDVEKVLNDAINNTKKNLLDQAQSQGSTPNPPTTSTALHMLSNKLSEHADALERAGSNSSLEAESSPAEAATQKLTLKRVASRTITARRFSTASPILPSKSDAPLLQAIAALRALGSTLEEQGKSDEAESVLGVITLLQTAAMNKHGSQKHMLTTVLDGSTPEEALGMQHWMEHVMGPRANTLAESSGIDKSATQNSELAHRLQKLSRKIPSLVDSSDAGKLDDALESVYGWIEQRLG